MSIVASSRRRIGVAVSLVAALAAGTAAVVAWRGAMRDREDLDRRLACTSEATVGKAPGGPAACESECRATSDVPICRAWAAWARSQPGLDQRVQEADARACTAGDGPSCLVSGQALERAGELQSAAETYRAACDAHADAGCSALARLAIDESVKTSSLEDVDALLIRGCEANDSGACARAAKRAEAVDVSAATMLHGRACFGKIAASCLWLADRFPPGGDSPRTAEVEVQALNRLACEGSGEGEFIGCFRQATSLAALGRGEDAEKAADLFEKACRGDVAAACFGLAELARQDEGAAYDPKAIRALDRQACEAGIAAACVAEARDDTASDPLEAIRLFKRACELGSVKGCVEGATLGEGSSIDAVSVAQGPLWISACEIASRMQDTTNNPSWFEVQRKNELDLSCTRAARALAEGRGVTADKTRALQLWRRVYPDAKTLPATFARLRVPPPQVRMGGTSRSYRTDPLAIEQAIAALGTDLEACLRRLGVTSGRIRASASIVFGADFSTRVGDAESSDDPRAVVCLRRVLPTIHVALEGGVIRVSGLTWEWRFR